MSDDGYYPGSPYDDLDDLYYDDDIEDNLADDLAQHTLPSPIYHEDPAYEMLEYHSDWEYYSDDYYDDDPALLKANPQIGSPLKRKLKTDKSQPRGKKRRLVDTKDIPELILDDRPALAATIRGTVWRGPKPQSPKPYEVGQGERIALLKNWAQIFGRSSPRSTMKRDESWANDLSLEDMGLRKVESVPGKEGGLPALGEDDLGEEDETDHVDGEGYMDEIDAVDGELDANGDVPGHINGTLGGAADYREEMMDDPEAQPTKRQRITAPMPSPPPSNDSSNNSTETIVQDMKKTSMAGRDSIEPSNSRTKKESYPEMNSTLPKKIAPPVTNMKTRKRKASPDAEPTDTITSKSTASSRAKRVASSKLVAAKEEKPPPVPKTTRTTRSKK
jgi:hypothetical protein